jgi:hypothetical protein
MGGYRCLLLLNVLYLPIDDLFPLNRCFWPVVPSASGSLHRSLGVMLIRRLNQAKPLPHPSDYLAARADDRVRVGVPFTLMAQISTENLAFTSSDVAQSGNARFKAKWT